MNRQLVPHRTLWVMLALLAHGNASGHGHAAAIDPDQPDAWKFRLCGEMATVALQALHDRDKGRTMRTYSDDGGPGARIANALIKKVYAEPAIASPKRAEAFGRAFCNESLQNDS
jgi:hypothetical protein